MLLWSTYFLLNFYPSLLLQMHNKIRICSLLIPETIIEVCLLRFNCIDKILTLHQTRALSKEQDLFLLYCHTFEDFFVVPVCLFNCLVNMRMMCIC